MIKTFTRNKFNVSPKEDRTCNGITFASKKEMKRYKELKILEKTGKITWLSLQPRFTLQEKFTDNAGNNYRAIEYVADFQYECNGQKIVEETKGFKTPEYIIKKKLFLKKYPEYHFIER